MSQIFWKASSIDNLTDARFFNAMENAWIEFVFDVLAPRSVSIDQAKNIIEWLFEPNLLASFGMHQTAEEIFYVLEKCTIQYAAIPLEHPLASDEDFAPIAFIKLSKNSLRKAIELEYPPFAFIISLSGTITDNELSQIIELQRYSKVILQLPISVDTVKDKIKSLTDIGIEIPTQPEQSPGWGAVDIYDRLMEALES